MERLIFLPLIITAYAVLELIDASILLFDSLVTVQLEVKIPPFTNAQLRSIGAKGKTKEELILSLALA